MNDQSYNQSNSSPRDERDKAARYLDLIVMSLLALGILLFLGKQAQLLTWTWSGAILVFVVARIRQFYVRYRHTRLLYWLPILVGNVKQRVYVRPRLGRMKAGRHSAEPVAMGASDGRDRLLAPESSEPSFWADDTLPEPLEADEAAEPESDPAASESDEQTKVHQVSDWTDAEPDAAPEVDYSDPTEPEEASDVELPAEKPISAEADIEHATGIDASRLERLRARLSQGAQALTHLAPPVDAPVQPASEAADTFVSAEEGIEDADFGDTDFDAKINDKQADDGIETVSPARGGEADDEINLEAAGLEPDFWSEESSQPLADGSSPDTAGSDESDQPQAEQREVVPADEEDSPPVQEPQARSGAASLRERLHQRQAATQLAPSRPVGADVPAGDLRERLRQRQIAKASGETPADETVSAPSAAAAPNALASRLRDRLSTNDSEATPITNEPAEIQQSETPAHSDAAARLRDRLRQRREGSSDES